MKRTCLGFALAAGALLTAFGGDARTCSADFGAKVREIRPALHSTGWAPRLYPRFLNNDDAAIKSMRFAYTRTHDWALVNSGQRIIDTCRVFKRDRPPCTPVAAEWKDGKLALSKTCGGSAAFVVSFRPGDPR